MKWYLKVVKDNYANFNGRASRQEFWMFVLFNLIFSIAAGALDSMLGTMFISAIYGLAVLIPGLGVSIRRLHDTSKSGWFLLLALVPVINLVVIYFFILESKNSANEYGDPPN